MSGVREGLAQDFLAAESCNSSTDLLLFILVEDSSMLHSLFENVLYKLE